MTELEDERTAELETLEAIYGSSLVARSEYSACLELPLLLPKPLQIRCLADGGGTGATEVSHLPPLRIRFKLPHGYPNEAGPTIHVESLWLPEDTARKLALEGTSLWEEYGHTQVMFAYVSHLEEAAEAAFGLKSLEVTSDVQCQLLVFNQSAKQHAFEKGTYECGVCLDPKKGTWCHQMGECRHVFCIDCLQGYYNNAIMTGNIDDVKCPNFSCGGNDRCTQRTRLITPRELLRIPIERPAVQRYVNLRRKRKLEIDNSTMWCPRQWCQGAALGNNYPKSDVPLEEMDAVYEEDIDCSPVVIEALIEDSDETEDTAEAREEIKERALLASLLQICEDCSYAFCHLCRRTWHGDFFDCRARISIPSERTILEQEEESSLVFIRNNTTKCPKCDTPVQKSEACNHMTCVQCRSHFCYLCSTFLNPMHPYDHFNTMGGWCYQRLWEGQNGEAVNR
ncbi:RWD-domain-containing protein [Didymella exigua CBS 183.55]|uniref:RBR-type E3 ubiquitin transferase n=1 Tax=Didymella exigua CBS 183.55 TaxID=1150837 RepID=A0A6A5RZ29_9PLEO|nr:RWD-domain-containing protein [Didymella exigua CBS 183.55]KAF1930507.1 RWD-domain-containing protein [Didymella exigua CBS 183.55]